jgi:hypothetical protein
VFADPQHRVDGQLLAAQTQRLADLLEDRDLVLARHIIGHVARGVWSAKNQTASTPGPDRHHPGRSSGWLHALTTAGRVGVGGYLYLFE